MELSAILDALEGSDETTTKTASVSDTAASSNLESALDAALSMDKTASVYTNNTNSPSEDLVKIAQKLADAEQLALVKEAEMYGAAVCDGFLARMNEHESNGVKVASFGGADVDEVLLKQAMELGYRETQQQLEKVAQDAYAQGYNQTIGQASENAEAEKIAALALQAGYNDTMKALHANQQEKVAQDGAMIKQAAENRAQQGYNHANRILANLAG